MKPGRGTNRRTKILGIAVGLLFPIACGPAASPRPENLVLISLDTLTPLRMSTYGGPRDTTPTLSAIAARGLLFRNAFTTSPWTLPAHAAMLTGLYPSSLSVDPTDDGLFRAAPTLAQRFRAAGYATGAVTGGGFVSKDVGADRGFETFAWSGPPRAQKWLRQHRDERFFLFFHTYTAHSPYNDKRYANDLHGGRLHGIFDSKPAGGPSRLNQSLVRGNFARATDEEREYLLALYDGGVRRADEMVAKLWGTLEELNLLDRTVVIVTSDHGEEFWGATGRAAYHGHTLYDDLLRVPLIWYDPYVRNPGREIDENVSLLDIVPTVLQRFGLDPAEAQDGIDLTPVFANSAPAPSGRTLFAEGVRHGPARTSVRTERGKLIETPNLSEQLGEGKGAPVPVRAPLELYLPRDAEEAENRREEEPELVAELLEALMQHRSRAATERAPGASEGVSDETRARLRALGYTED